MPDEELKRKKNKIPVRIRKCFSKSGIIFSQNFFFYLVDVQQGKNRFFKTLFGKKKQKMNGSWYRLTDFFPPDFSDSLFWCQIYENITCQNVDVFKTNI